MKNLFDYKYNLVCEGGAAGHMAHPFDLPIVKAPIDIVTFFDNLTAALKKDEKAFMKIDGVNASVRLNDKGEFVLDRMSMKPLDVIGVTKDKLIDRFGAGHGFLIIGATVLDIFNEALPGIQQELKMLGMNGGKRMLNIEYVSGTTNVIETDKKFLAIHGLLDIIQATPKKRVTKEVSSYNKGILNKLIDKVNAVAEKYGFTVYNQFLAMLDGEPDYKKVLSQDLEINISGVPTKKPVRDWVLNAVPVSSDTMVVSKTKGKIAAISKYVLQYVLNGGCISDDFQGDSYLVLSGFLMYYLTMVLGAELLRCINSDLGRGDTQEGIVIRNSSLTGADRPVKITGAFILKGMSSKFRVNENINESIYSNLGLNDALCQDWIDRYNKQRGLGWKFIYSDGEIRDEKGRMIRCIDINDPSILDNGCLPKLPFDIDETDFGVSVGTPELKSFDNLPEVKAMQVMISAPVNCLNTITNCEYISLRIAPITEDFMIRDIKPIIYNLQVNKISTLSFSTSKTREDTAGLINILNHIKGCKFGYFCGESPYINIAYASAFLKNTDSISNFFKNNTFTNPIAFVMDKTPDLKFVNDVPDVGFMYLQCTPPSPKKWITDFESPIISDFLAPAVSNRDKFPCHNSSGDLRFDFVGINSTAKEKLNKELIYRYHINFKIR